MVLGCFWRRRRHREPKQHAPPRNGLSVVQTIDINAPLETVWQVMVNVANYPTVMRDTTRIQPLDNNNNGTITKNNNIIDYSNISTGAKYRQYLHHPKWRTKHEMDFVITHVGKVKKQNDDHDNDDDDDDNVRSFASAARFRGGDFTAAQTAERIFGGGVNDEEAEDDDEDDNNNNHDHQHHQAAAAATEENDDTTTRSCEFFERTRLYATFAYIPCTLRGRILVTWLFRYPLLAEGNYAARNVCLDVKAAAEAQQQERQQAL